MKTRTALGPILLALALLSVAPATLTAQEQAETVSDPDAKCVRCHSRGLKKKLEDGETLSLKIDVDAFGSSVHRVIGCTGCHRDVAKGKHPSREPIASARAYALEQNQTCRQCHQAKYEAYEGSIHASLVSAGSDRAPLCSDCHSSHAIQPRSTYEPDNGKPCSTCHDDIFQAYEESVHGTARREGNRIRGSHVSAPVCADCHKAHDISAVASTDYLVSTCMNCHEVAQLAHEQWLPNATMHLKSVGCAACHAPNAALRVDLQLFDRLADAPVDSSEQYAAFRERLEDVDTDGKLGAMDLWKLVRLTERDGMDTDVMLRGRLEVASGMDAHRLADSTHATRSCESCHESRSEAFRNVTISITSPDGRRERFEADSDVLSSVFSVDSISGFYAPGGTRIKLLDYLLVLAILGGLAVPVVHITLGKIVRKKSGKKGPQ
jgi:mono/diheme cytochrome c family protein